MILMPDLFSFAYVPNWYSQLESYILNEKSRYSDFGAIHPCDL